MKESYIQSIGIAIAVVYGVFIAFLYIAEPRSFEEVTIKAVETVQNVATEGRVITGMYEIDKDRFNEGLTAFRANNFVAARDLFARADPQTRDAATQFYIAYSFYRQGWGRLSNDDALFNQSLKALQRVEVLDKTFRSDDADLQLRTPAELRSEVEEGLRVTADDFNPFKILRERK